MLLYETRGEAKFWYSYDSNGILYNIRYTLTDDSDLMSYYCTHNSRGDIIGIYNGNGVLRAQYKYDSWGNVISVTDENGNAITSATHVGNLNPFRYRGYYYDTESGFYYLMSRYYDPVTHRFINADGYFQSGGNILDANMSAYGRNNPITYSDPSGEFVITASLTTIIQAVVTAVVIATIVTIVAHTLSKPSVQQAISNAVNSVKSNTKSKDVAIPANPPKKSNLIYRYGGTNPGNLTPKSKDASTGLSFSTLPPPIGTPAAVTTIEKLNSTGQVFAFQDSPTHVTVKPCNATVQEWIDEGSKSKWTAAVKESVQKWDGIN